MSADIRYAHSPDGIDIAYQVIGDGDVDIVFIPGFVSHLDLMWDVPYFAAIRDRLATIGRLVTFDKRGTGLSDRTLGFGSLEERMQDIRHVMDAAGVDDAHLFGISEGGPLALLFAANHPERVVSVATYGTFARMMGDVDYPIGMDPVLIEGFLAAVRKRWGSGRAMPFFLQNVPESREVEQSMARYERSACTPQMASEILQRNVEIDIRALLTTVRVPTVVLHSTGDPLVPVAHGRYLADHLPAARLVEQPADFHGSWRAEDAWFLDDLQTCFGADSPGRVPSSTRKLATILFTDIVESTQHAVAMGDDAWRKVLDAHDDACAQAVGRFGGHLVKSTGDGLLATFDSPSAGIDCAREIRGRVSALGIKVRAGVHTGEVEVRGDVGGIGVHIGARIASLAGTDEVWVSRTVKDLTTGSGLELVDRGRHPLKGVPDEWELYAVS
jgi:class 3 adenylate cyclase